MDTAGVLSCGRRSWRLRSWRELRVPVLDFTEFGDTSDFRGIGSDQARFRKEVLSKLSAVATMLSQQGAPQGVA